MKRGFVLISTLALIVILSFLVLILSKTIYSDTLKTTVYANSIEKRIEIINYESFLVDLLIDNSILNKNLTLAEQEINFAIQKKFPQLTVSLTDYSTCFNINSLVKPFQNINVKNEYVINYLMVFINSFYLHSIVSPFSFCPSFLS